VTDGVAGNGVRVVVVETRGRGVEVEVVTGLEVTVGGTCEIERVLVGAGCMTDLGVSVGVTGFAARAL
jgi:hypothetical protein